VKRTINRFAADDLAEAVRFDKREAGVGLARRFLSEFERVVSLLEQHPGLGKPTNDGRRMHPLTAFPYSVIYRSEEDALRMSFCGIKVEILGSPKVADK
jgi:plasmid stabilization system protein ParE